jgi:cytochrome c-type biogenesis protein CcmE
MTEHSHTAPNTRFNLRRNRLALAAAGLLVVGGAAGAVTVAATRPSVTMAPATPVAIRSLQSDGIVTIRGTVAETYGNKFVMADRTGRALVDLGREGEGSDLVAVGQPVTIQGRFEDGFVHASFLVAPGGKVTALGPVGGPPRGPHGPGGPGRDGPGRDGPGRDGPDGPSGPGAPPPPPVGVAPPPTANGAVTPAPVAPAIDTPATAPTRQATPAT